jgi:hypothetical protein
MSRCRSGFESCCGFLCVCSSVLPPPHSTDTPGIPAIVVIILSNEQKDLVKKIRERHEARKRDPEAQKRRKEIFRKFGTLTEEDLKKRFTI